MPLVVSQPLVPFESIGKPYKNGHTHGSDDNEKEHVSNPVAIVISHIDILVIQFNDWAQ